MFDGSANNPIDLSYTVSQVLNLESYGITYDYGPLFDNTGVIGDADCPNGINANWFQDFTGNRRRRRLNEENNRTGRRERNKGTGRTKRVRFKPFSESRKELREELGQEAELYVEMEECTNGRTACPISDFEDCSGMTLDEIDALTIEDIISMRGLNDCQIAAREGQYEFAKNMGYLKPLCMGCMDPVCDRSINYEKCAVGAEDRRRSTLRKRRSEGVIFENNNNGHKDDHNNLWNLWSNQFTFNFKNVSVNGGIVFGVISLITLFAIWIFYRKCCNKKGGYEKVEKYIEDFDENDV